MPIEKNVFKPICYLQKMCQIRCLYKNAIEGNWQQEKCRLEQMSIENRVYATTNIANQFKSNKKMPLRQIGITKILSNKLSLKMEFRQTVIGKHAIRFKSLWKRAPKVIIMIKQLPISATRWLPWSQIFFLQILFTKKS